jgi:hypothetical protein
MPFSSNIPPLYQFHTSDVPEWNINLDKPCGLDY